MSPEPLRNFFISYNKADLEWAEWIAWQLEAAGYTITIQAWDFASRSNFVAAMHDALINSERTILVLSPDSVASAFVKAEWTAIVAQDPDGQKGILKAVRVQKCSPTGILAPIPYIDLVDIDKESAKTELLKRLAPGRHKPEIEPTFPIKKAEPQFPGLPAIWNIPHPKNPNFTGREDELSAIHTTLTSHKTAALTQPQAIRGLGGVGKTQIATEYAYRHQSEYNVVWWIKSETTASLASDFAALAAPLKLEEAQAQDQNVTIAAVLNYLRMHDRWLLIFDNVENPDQVKPYLPPSGRGHILITSRYSAWGGVAKPVDVEVWPKEQAVEFLLKRTNEQDEVSALALAKELGCLPLALEQAGAYIERDQITLSKYLQRYRDKQTQLFGIKRAKPEGYEGTVLTTWQISLDKVRAVCPESIDLMNLCAFFAPDDIPLEIIIAGAEHLPEALAASVQDPEKLDDEVIATLLDYSLLDRKGDSLSLHRLVQAVIRDNMSEAEQKLWAAAAVKIVDDALPSGVNTAVEIWPIYARILPHAQAAAGYAETLQVEPDATARLLNQSAVYLQGRAQYHEAKSLYKRAIAIGEQTVGFKETEIATYVNNLGNVLQGLGDLPGAKTHFERALKIDEQSYGPDHPEVATDVNNLGLVLLALGDLPGAKALLERALKIDEQTYGSNHPEVARDVNNLGLVLRDLGDLPGAKAHFERALKIDEATYGPDHPNVAIRLNNLGLVLQDLRDLPGAKAHYERALKIGEKVHGAEHPQVAIYVNNLGSVLRHLGDLPGAKALYERALKIDEKTYGPDHPEVAIDINNLGLVLKNLGDLSGAKAHFERALKIDEATYGPDHPTVAIRLNNLGMIYREIGDKSKAREYLERALSMFTKFLGPDHPTTKTVRESLASLNNK